MGGYAFGDSAPAARRLGLLADDPGARVDIPVWCRLKDQQLLARHDRPDGGWVFQVRRAH